MVEDMENDTGSKTTPHTNQVQVQAVEPDVPGTFPTKPVPTIPEWYTVGWRQACGIDKPPLSEDEKDHNILHTFIGEQFYGAWYHNAGIIIFVCVTPLCSSFYT